MNTLPKLEKYCLIFLLFVMGIFVFFHYLHKFQTYNPETDNVACFIDLSCDLSVEDFK